VLTGASDNLIEVSGGCFQSLKANSGIVLRLRHEDIILNSSYIYELYSLDAESIVT
jgi:hypothetical protein